MSDEKKGLDGYDTPNPRVSSNQSLKPFSVRIMEEIERAESKGRTPRRDSFVVIPQIDWDRSSPTVREPRMLAENNIWQKMGNRTFYRLYGLNYFSGRKGDPDTCGIQTAIKHANSKIFIKDAFYPLNSQLTQPKSNLFIEGEGPSADNAASYPNATFNGTILSASATFPAGASLAVPTYIILIGGNALTQAQGGGIKNLVLANARGISAGNVGGIGMGFALSMVVDNIGFGAYNQAGPTDYGLSGPAIAFDPALSNPTQGSPTSGYFYVDECRVTADNGGEEVIRIHSGSCSDVWFNRWISFARSYNNGIVDITSGTGIHFDKCLFYCGTNNIPAIRVNGSCTGLRVTNSRFTQSQGATTGALVYLNITGDNTLDNDVGVNFLDNAYLIYPSKTTTYQYIYDIEATTANCLIVIRGDQVWNDSSGGPLTYAKIVPTSNVKISRPVFLKGSITHPFGFFTTTPSVPSTGVAYTNILGFAVRIYVLTATGATYTLTDADGNVSASMTLSPGQEIVLDPMEKITPTYTTLTWKFYGW